MHRLILAQHDGALAAHERLDGPLHHRVAPVRRHLIGRALASTMVPDAPERGLDKRLSRGRHHRRPSQLRHGAHHQVALHALHQHPLGRQLRTESRRPRLQERLAAGVRCEEWGGEDAGERGHGEDEAALPLHHPGGDDLRDAQSGMAVDVDDVFQLVALGLDEGDGD